MRSDYHILGKLQDKSKKENFDDVVIEDDDDDVEVSGYNTFFLYLSVLILFTALFR